LIKSRVKLERGDGVALKVKTKLEWLEFGRGCAAIAVVLCHVRWYLIPTPDYMHFVDSWGEWGVEFFFVLSGFIIAYVHKDHIGKPSKAANFAWRRFIRIFPTYWLVLAISLGSRQFLGNADHRIEITPGWIVLNLAFLPGSPLFINVAWTLRHELLFYGMFLIAIFNLRIGIIAFSLWAMLIGGALLFSPAFEDSDPLGVFTHWRNLLFFAGVAVAWVYHHGYLEALPQVAAPPFSLFLGAISYPLYLIHIPMMLAVHGLFKRLGMSDQYWLLQTSTTIFFSLACCHLIVRYFEQPLFREFRTRPKAALSP
jgi:exopolysaccharide production protein ExoZ